MKTPVLLLVNPVAGHSTYRSALGEITLGLYRGGYQPTVCFTEYPGQARELARELGGDYPLLVCLGGRRHPFGRDGRAYGPAPAAPPGLYPRSTATGHDVPPRCA